MKRLPVFAAGACALFAASAIPATAQPPPRQIGAIPDDMARAANAHDTNRFMAHYRHGPELVFVFNGVVVHGWNALHAQQSKWWRHGKSDVVYTQTGPTEFMPLAPDVWTTTQTLSSWRTGPDGKPAVGKFAVTDVWRKESRAR